MNEIDRCILCHIYCNFNLHSIKTIVIISCFDGKRKGTRRYYLLVPLPKYIKLISYILFAYCLGLLLHSQYKTFPSWIHLFYLLVHLLCLLFILCLLLLVLLSLLGYLLLIFTSFFFNRFCFNGFFFNGFYFIGFYILSIFL